MYKSIYVPVDNSDHSNRAVASALALGKAYSAKLVGCHVYAAKLHDYRFRQMEYTLPEEYIDEVELERQRKIHDSLITMGLKLISDSYLDGMSRLCKESSLEFEPRMMDGKHHAEILKDVVGSHHDLVVIGALGIGRARDSVIDRPVASRDCCRRTRRTVVRRPRSHRRPAAPRASGMACAGRPSTGSRSRSDCDTRASRSRSSS